ncbi:MAG: hypothetical protein HYZ34_07805, partial [Ignavibacteriae bacterium]|nr:hypothetical protein [Ignavibacteriota bacterium]
MEKPLVNTVFIFYMGFVMKRLVQSSFLFFVILSTFGAFAFGQKVERTTQGSGSLNVVLAVPTVTSFSPSSGS